MIVIVDDEVTIVMIVMMVMIMMMWIMMITILTINSVIQLSPTGAPPNIATPCYWTLTSTLFLWWGWWSWWWQWWWWRWHAAMHSRKKRNLGIWPWAYNADGENHLSFAFHEVIQWPSNTKSSGMKCIKVTCFKLCCSQCVRNHKFCPKTVQWVSY